MEILLPVIIVGIIGLVAGLGLSLASKFMAVPVDERQEKIREVLPGANCGACGFSGCDGYAAAVAAGEAEPNKCAPGGAAAAAGIAAVLGVEVEAEPKIAFIACNGTCESTGVKYSYSGLQSCSAAAMLHSGPLKCSYGCVGFGDCAAACPFGAITLKNGRPVICAELCVGCGKCAAACPKRLIELIPKNAKIHIHCSSCDKGTAAVKACKVSCVACKMCEKACESGALKIKDNRPVIDRSLCVDCGKCAESCKRGVITRCINQN